MTPCSAAACGRRSSRDELAVDLRADLLGQLDLGELLAQLVDLGLGRVALAQLLLDRLELLAQEELALRALDLALDLGLDARADLDDLELAARGSRAIRRRRLRDVALLEQRLLAPRSSAAATPAMRCDERARVVDVGDGDLQLLGQVGQRLDDLRRTSAGRCARARSARRLARRRRAPPRPRRRGTASRATQRVTRTRGPAWTRIRSVPSGALIIRAMTPTTPTSYSSSGGGLLELGVAAGDHDDRAVVGERVVDELDRARLADRQRHHRVGEARPPRAAAGRARATGWRAGASPSGAPLRSTTSITRSSLADRDAARRGRVARSGSVISRMPSR